MKGRTSIVIAHRLSTIRDADQIAVISNVCLASLGFFLLLWRCPAVMRSAMATAGCCADDLAPTRLLTRPSASCSCVHLHTQGVVRELGTHDALLATPGSTYAELHRMQNADGGGDAADHHNGVVAAPGGGGGGAALAHLASVDES